MCDGCPDITVWEDHLLWSCRLEEQMKFGCFVRAVPKQGVKHQPHELFDQPFPFSGKGLKEKGTEAVPTDRKASHS